MVQKLRDLIDRIFTKLKIIKYKEQILYIIVGGGTTVVDWIVYALFVLFVPSVGGEFIKRISPNILSYSVAWLCAVLFAYVFSRLFVFEMTGEKILPQFVKFFFSRVLTLVLSIAGDVVLCGEYALIPIKNAFIAKLIISVAVIIINYITSKVFVFKKKDENQNG
ncbi:MAG: GtrA family protein [Clostridiales bacterium]|nr:GtrA family protein [Clostridiales bacterium]